MNPSSISPNLSRRRFLGKTVKGAALASLFGGLPKGWVGGAYADDSPESPRLRCGIIALTDCSPFVIGAEKGFFKKYGVEVTIVKGASWAAIRDSLAAGDNQLSHMLVGMPIASTMGLLGSPKKSMIVPWLVNRNGQGIALKTEWKGKIGANPKALRPFVEAAKKRGQPLTFAMTFPPGTHAMWMRYYLGAGGINPDLDAALITVPPAQMISNMKVGSMDGFCVGEPWNARAIMERVGFNTVVSQDIWPDHVEKVCGFTEEFADKNPKTVKAVLKGLHDTSVWLDDLANRPEQCDIVSRPNYINCQKHLILGRLLGHLDYGDGRKIEDAHYMHFSKRNCNYPQPKFGKWWLTQFRRWGMVTGKPDYDGVTAKVFRPDIYTEAMREIGVTDRGEDNSGWTMFDGVSFDPSGDLEAYANGFAVNNVKG